MEKNTKGVSGGKRHEKIKEKMGQIVRSHLPLRRQRKTAGHARDPIRQRARLQGLGIRECPGIVLLPIVAEDKGLVKYQKRPQERNVHDPEKDQERTVIFKKAFHRSLSILDTVDFQVRPQRLAAEKIL